MKLMYRVNVSDGEGTRYESGRTYDVPEAKAKDHVGRGYADVVSPAARKNEQRQATRRAPSTPGGDAKGRTARTRRK